MKTKEYCEQLINKNETPTEEDIIMLERALRLKCLSSFEYTFVVDLKARFINFGKNMRITDKQREVLKQLSDRFLNIYLIVKEENE